MPDTTTAPAQHVRLLLAPKGAPRERMWGELIAPDRMRVLGVSLFCDVSLGDVLPVERVCGCGYGDGVEHYVPTGIAVERVSRHVVAYTFGNGRRRMAEVVDYLTTWPTDDGSTYESPIPGMVFARVFECGHIAGLAAVSRVDDGDTRWGIAFPLDAPEGRIHQFLDGLPYLAAHGLQPEDE